jgi:nucleoid DNA-binding protein
MTRIQLRKRVLATVPVDIRKAMGELSEPITNHIVDATLEAIMDATVEGEKVRIYGFGSLETSVRPPHLVYCNLSHDPGFKVTKPHVRVYLRPCTAWKDRLSCQVQNQFDEIAEQQLRLAKQKTKGVRNG